MKTIEVYTDGACSNNQGIGGQPGGWAAVFVEGESISGSELETTNNRMEMTAVIEALKRTVEGSHIRIYSDSAYIINCFKQNWIQRWEQNGWITSSKKPVENQDLWKMMRQLQKDRNIEWIKVKGHSGNKWNELADTLAVEAMNNGQITSKKENSLKKIQLKVTETQYETVIQALSLLNDQELIQELKKQRNQSS